MGHHVKKTLLLSVIIVGFSLFGRANCKEREEKQQAETAENGNITPSPLVGSTNGWRPVIPSTDETAAMSRSHTYHHIGNDGGVVLGDAQQPSIRKHPVLNKLHQHMESAEKAKLKRLQEEAAAFSTRGYDGAFYSTTPNILGTFSSFGHATVLSKEPAVSKQEIIKGKKKKHDPHSYQVAESINEYSLHLVPPPRTMKVPSPYPIMTEVRRKKPFPGYRYPSPSDLHVEEQRHAYFVQPAPSRAPYTGSVVHTPKPPTYFFGGPQIPNFAGHGGPPHYPGALAGALFPAPDSIRYFQRPEMHNAGGSQYTHPPPIPLDAGKQRQQEKKPAQEVTYRRPEQSPFKTSQQQQQHHHQQQQHQQQQHQQQQQQHQQEVEFVTGRPSLEVRAPESNSFTVGTSFLAGNKHEDNSRPSLTVQNTGPQQFYPAFSTVQPPTFEQAFDTGRPSNKDVITGYRIPATLTNAQQGDKVRDTKPFVAEEAVKNVHITGPGNNFRQQQFDSLFPPGVVEEVVEVEAPHFLPTVTSDSSPTFLHDAQAHLNEVPQNNRPWGHHFSTAEPIREVELQQPQHVRDEVTTPTVIRDDRPYRQRRPPTTASVASSSQAQMELAEQGGRFESTTDRRPSFEEEESVTEVPTLPPREQEERRPYQTRKPVRHRQRPTQHREQEDDGSYRPTQYGSKHADAVAPTEARPKQRRRRPTAPAASEAVSTPAAAEEEDVAKYNHVSAALDGAYDKINPSTTPRPSRRKNPNGGIRGQERQRVRTTTTDAPVAEAFEALTEAPIAAEEAVVQQTFQGGKEYAVYEDNQEAEEVVTKVSDEYYTHELPSTATTSTSTSTTTTSTTTTTTTPPPTTTPTTTTTEAPVASTTSRYKPRNRYGLNSTRPRFSVKDYKERLNRLSHLSSTEPRADSTTTPTAATEPAPPRRYPGRIRNAAQKHEEAKVDDAEETAPDATIESMRNKFRPKFGASRFRTTTATPAAAEESGTERVASRPSTPRLRLPPTGKYYSRYRTTTESTVEEKIDTGSDKESVPAAKIPMKPRVPFSPRKRFPPRGKLGAQNEVIAPVHAEDSDGSNSNSEHVKMPTESVTPRQEYTTNFGVTDMEGDDARPTLPNVFSSFEELSQSYDNEIPTKATKTFLYLPTMPTTLQFDFETQTTRDGEDFTTVKNLSDIDSVDLSNDDEASASQRVADLTSAATSGGYFNTMLIAKRKPAQYVMSTEDPILPIEAFFTNKEYHKD